MISLLYDYVYTFPIYILTLVFLQDVLEIPQRSFGFYLFALLIMGLITSLKSLSNSIRILLSGVFSVVVLGTILVQKPSERIDFMMNHLWMVWMILIAVVMFVIGRLIIASRSARLVCGLALIAVLAVSLALNITVDKLTVSLTFFEILVFLVEEIQHSWIKSGDTDPKKHLVFLLPAMIFIFLCVTLSPVREEPYDWKFVYETQQRIVNFAKSFTRYLPGRGEDYAAVGFSEASSIVGGIRANTKTFFEFSAGKESGLSTHLGGKVFDTFTGRDWESINTAENSDRQMDFAETFCSVKEFAPQYPRDYLRFADLKIRYQIFNTEYLFVPAKASIERDRIGDVSYVQRADALVSSDGLGYGTEYSVHYYRLNKDNPEFADLVNNCPEITEEDWERNNDYFDYLAYDDYLAYRDRVYEDYTEKIVLSDSLASLISELNEGAESDWEKCKRIESFLLTFDYNNEPGTLPEKVQDAKSFLDYFMLEKREGYCVHFATAMTLLARAEGRPARMVQGFLVSRGSYDDVLVRGDMAHAWAEIYFDNIGWIVFDATPGYHTSSYWQTSIKAASVAKKIEEKKVDYEELNNKYTLEPEDEDKEESVKKHIDPLTIILPVVLALLFVITFVAMFRIYSLRKYEKLDNATKAKLMCRTNIQILEELGFRLTNGETLEEFASRISDSIPKECLAFIRCYEVMIYKEIEATEENYSVIEKSNQALLELLKEDKGRMVFLYRLKLSISFYTMIK